MKLLFAAPGDAGAGGAGGGNAAGAGGTHTGGTNSSTGTADNRNNAAGAGDGTQGQAGTQGQVGAGGQQQTTEKSFTYKEDRSKWLPPHRLKEVETATEKRVRGHYEREVDDRQRKIEALMGVTREPNVDPDVEKARQAFFSVFPEMKELFETFGPQETRAAIKELIDNRSALLESAGFTFNSYGTRVLGELFTGASEIFGIEMEKLTKGQKDKIFAAFKDRLQTDEEFEQRYRMSDPKLVGDFLKEWADDIIEPVRGQSLSPHVRAARQPLPLNRGGRTVTTTKRSAVKPGDLDAVLDQAVDYMKDAGATFED